MKMKSFNKIFVFLLSAISLSFCASSQELKTVFPQEIAAVYFERWVGGREETGSGTHFYIEFKKPLSSTFRLQKVYFKNQVASFEKLTDNTFVAHFYNRKKNPDLIMHRDSLKEYGNEPPLMVKPKFPLKPNEALLEYKLNGKTRFYKIKNPKERPMMAYPSAKPRNE